MSIAPLAMAGIVTSFAMRYGDGILPRARNSIVGEFLNSDASDLVLIDDDVGWEPADLVKLVNYPVDCVAGVYPYKRDQENYPLRLIEDRAELWADPETGLLEVEAVPAGFLRLSRKCLESMAKAYPDLVYLDTALEREIPALFDFALENKIYWGEDFTFCRRWRAIGGKVWVAPEMRLRHSGQKMWVGCLGDFLRARSGIAK